MSLTVVPANNNSWQNQIFNFVSPLLSDWIKSAREAEINRKNNAAAAEILRSVGLGGDSNSNPLSLTTNNMSPNGWENAFHNQRDNPLATFDANTADFAPTSLTANDTSPNYNNNQSSPTLADIQRAVIQQLGTRRFGMVNPENLQKILNPLLTAYEANRIEGLRNNLADTLREAKNEAERKNSAWGGYAQGLLPLEAVNAAQAQYQYENPYSQPMNYNSGRQTDFFSFNPRNGQFEQGVSVQNSLTPQEVENNSFRREQLEENRKQFNETMNYNRESSSRELALRERQQTLLEDEARWKREHPEYVTFADNQGRLWGRKPGESNSVPVTGSDGQQIIVDPNTYRTNPTNTNTTRWTPGDTKFLESRNNAIADARKRRAIAVKARNETPNADERKKYEDEIAQIDADITKWEKEIDDYVRNRTSPNTPQNNPQNNSQPNPTTQNNSQPTNGQYDVRDDFGAMAINGANNGSVSAPFEQKRTKPDGSTYYHHGTDYPTAEGTEIRLIGGTGDYMTVTKVGNQPDGYGNYVDLQGEFTDKNGQKHTVTIRYAHMKYGSINVKQGDRIANGQLIGLVGNTGNSRGKNGGYHLHVETAIDGQLVDPQKFNRILTEHTTSITYTPPRDENQLSPEEKTEQVELDRTKRARVFFRNSNTGETISEYQFEQLMLQGEKGEIDGHREARTPEQVLEMIRNQGFDEDLRPEGYNWNSPNGRIILRNPNNNRVITEREYQEHLQRVKSGRLANLGIHDEAGYLAYMKSKGFEDYQYSNPKFSPVNSDRVAENNNNVGLTPSLTEQERERAQTQGNTGASIAQSSEQNNVGTLNGERNKQNNHSGIELNSEIMWENTDGRTISVSEYNNRLRLSGMENHDYDAWLENQGFRRADNSNTMPPPVTDVVNGTTPDAMQAQVDHLNGDDNNFIPAADRARTPLNTLFDFMSEAPSVNEAIRQKYPNDNRFESLLPFVRNPDTNSPHTVYRPYDNTIEDENGNDYQPYNDSPPNDYNPYDHNYPQPEPYSPDDPYERGFEFDNEGNSQNNGNGDFQTLPLVNYDNNDNNMTLLAARRNSRRKNQRRTTTVAPKRRFYPQRTPRKPGQIIPNTSYEQLRNEVDNSARRYGIDPELVRAIIQIESKWDSNATGPLTRYGHARGLMQLIDSTARDQGVRDSYNPAQNIEGGSKYIAYLIRRYKGNLAKALMAYNTGPGNVDKGRIPSVTRKYARDVMAIYNRLKSRRG